MHNLENTTKYVILSWYKMDQSLKILRESVVDNQLTMHQCCKSRVNLFRIRSQHFAYLDPDPVTDPTVTMY